VGCLYRAWCYWLGNLDRSLAVLADPFDCPSNGLFPRRHRVVQRHVEISSHGRKVAS
jgi:hypothetical protein